eukprot:g2419.t1
MDDELVLSIVRFMEIILLDEKCTLNLDKEERIEIASTMGHMDALLCDVHRHVVQHRNTVSSDKLYKSLADLQQHHMITQGSNRAVAVLWDKILQESYPVEDTRNKNQIEEDELETARNYNGRITGFNPFFACQSSTCSNKEEGVHITFNDNSHISMDAKDFLYHCQRLRATEQHLSKRAPKSIKIVDDFCSSDEEDEEDNYPYIISFFTEAAYVLQFGTNRKNFCVPAKKHTSLATTRDVNTSTTRKGPAWTGEVLALVVAYRYKVKVMCLHASNDWVVTEKKTLKSWKNKDGGIETGERECYCQSLIKEFGNKVKETVIANYEDCIWLLQSMGRGHYDTLEPIEKGNYVIHTSKLSERLKQPSRGAKRQRNKRPKKIN